MPRRPRVHLDNVPLHIVQRGHNRQPCFLADEDYRAYLHWLSEALRETDCRLHAYVLMTNHVHLLVTPMHANTVPDLIISLGRRYVQYINTTYRRTGTLWDSRYKSSLIQADTYLLECMRYIELNPVRAGMVSEPAAYPWSSYSANGLGARNDWVFPHSLYLELGRDADSRQHAYRNLFHAHLDKSALDDIRVAVNQNQPLGNARFYAEIERLIGERRQARPRGRPKHVGIGHIETGQEELGV